MFWTNWAARFLAPTLPFLLLLCAPLLELILEPSHDVSPFTAFRAGSFTPHVSSFTLFRTSSFTPHVLRFTFHPSRCSGQAVSRFTFHVSRFTFAILALISFLNALAGVSIHSLTYRLALFKVSENPDWDAIFQSALSPLIGHWQILKPTNLEFAWLRVTLDAIQVDWIAIASTVGVILFALYMLARVLRGEEMPRVATRINLALAVALTLIVIARYANDPRLGGNDGYRRLLETVAQKAAAQDVLILNDDAHARYFFSTNRARLKWYGLSRDPARWDAPTQALVTRLGQTYARVWFAYDGAVDAPNPMRDWMAEHWQAVQRLTFEGGVTLVLYATR
ncbi:MAG: hypothetical protein HY741_17975 [Chloroflexi bacterium]|nr:hypothetical protein [Chloroflexota bacterium]